MFSGLEFQSFLHQPYWGSTLIVKDTQQSTIVEVLFKIEKGYRRNKDIYMKNYHKYLVNKRHENILSVLSIWEGQVLPSDLLQISSENKEFIKFIGEVENFCDCIGIKTCSSDLNLLKWITKTCKRRLVYDNWFPQVSKTPNPLKSLEIHQQQLGIVEGLLKGMKYLHANKIVHGSLSPLNVVFTGYGKSFDLPVKIRYTTGGEFYSELYPSDYEEKELFISSNKYLPTEQSDIYSLGLVMQQVLQLLKSITILSFTRPANEIQSKYHPVEDHPVILNAKELITQMIKEERNERLKSLINVELNFCRVVENEKEISSLTNKFVSLLNDPNGNKWFKNLQFGKTLGAGAFGVVLKAWDVRLHRHSAVKFLISDSFPKSSCTNNTEAKDSEQEFENNKTCFHPNLVKLYQHMEYNAIMEEVFAIFNQNTEFIRICLNNSISSKMLHIKCIEMELCGETLRHWIDDENKELFNINMFQLRIVLDIVKGVKYLHEKDILHRDLKPDNILFSFSESGEKYQFPIKIGDFGLATVLPSAQIHFAQNKSNLSKKIVEDYTLTSGRGTWSYRAPEVDEDKYGKQCDIYSLGLIIWEVLQLIPFSKRSDLFTGLKERNETCLVAKHPLISNAKDLIISMTLKDKALRAASIDLVRFTCVKNLYPSTTEELNAIFATSIEDCTIYLSETVYTGPFVCRSNYVTIKGMGRSTVFKSPKKADGEQAATVFTSYGRSFSLENIKFIGERTNRSVEYSILLYLYEDCADVKNVEFVNGGTAILMRSVTSSLRNITVRGATKGIFAGGSGHEISDIKIYKSMTGFQTNGSNQINNVSCKGCGIGMDVTGSRNDIKNIRIVKSTKSNATTGVFVSSHDNKIHNLKCSGYSSSRDEWGLRLTSRSEFNTISKSICGPIEVDGNGNKLENVDAQDLMELNGNNHVFDNCIAKVLKIVEFEGLYVTRESCSFGLVETDVPSRMVRTME